MSNLINTALAAVLALILGAFGLALDDMDDRHAEFAQAQALQDAQRDAEAQAMRERHAQTFCRIQHGESIVAWTPDGDFVCKPRRGAQVVAHVRALAQQATR